MGLGGPGEGRYRTFKQGVEAGVTEKGTSWSSRHLGEGLSRQREQTVRGP